jgi:hypothetical protein
MVFERDEELLAGDAGGARQGDPPARIRTHCISSKGQID